MYQGLSVNLLNLILSLSDALDLASPELSQHQLRTAFIAWEISKVAGLTSANIDLLLIASLLHDIGALSLENKIAVHQGETRDSEPHCILGAQVIRPVPVLGRSAEIIRYHHTSWQVLGRSREPNHKASQILLLSDVLERSIDRNTYILHQNQTITSKINSLSDTFIDPEVVECFNSVAVREEFWLDLVSPRMYSILLHNGLSRSIDIDLEFLTPISELFRNIIDFRSRFTATHSCGVATTASTLARLLGFTETEVGVMGVAGNLHDLGKLVIPNSILEKPDKLIKDEIAIMRQHTYFTYMVLNTIGGILQISEWAAFHHEKLDGSGYPFHLRADKLSLGARIMAVADIYTALAEDRPYRKGMSRQETLSILGELSANKHLDVNVFRVLKENYEEVHELTKRSQVEIEEYYEHEFASMG